METGRVEDKKPAARCFLTCQVAVMTATIILVVSMCVFMSAMPEVDPDFQASAEKQLQRLQKCETPRCDRDLLLHAVGQDPRCSLCKAGWLWWRGRCYFFSMGLQENLTWNESARFCQQHNSSLAVIEDPAEMDFLQCVMKKFQYFPFPWVGLTDIQEEGHWVWMDGSDLQHYMPLRVEWDTDHTDCADLRGERSLFAVRCDSSGPWVCKKDS